MDPAKVDGLALNKGAHSAHEGDLRSLIGDTRRLVAKIRDMLS